MIKLFRNIRKKLLEQGKIGNYLKYAIGEIILVVIGILIALQINNWNEMQTTDIVYHFGRDKVSIARRIKVNHLGRAKMSHP